MLSPFDPFFFTDLRLCFATPTPDTQLSRQRICALPSRMHPQSPSQCLFHVCSAEEELGSVAHAAAHLTSFRAMILADDFHPLVHKPCPCGAPDAAVDDRSGVRPYGRRRFFHQVREDRPLRCCLRLQRRLCGPGEQRVRCSASLSVRNLVCPRNVLSHTHGRGYEQQRRCYVRAERFVTDFSYETSRGAAWWESH